MEQLVKKVEQLLDTFAQEELGNRLSQFAMISLKNLVLSEIRKYKVNNVQQGKGKR